ncbi:MAG: hypothetical protein GF329_07170 [Candidatus Lokiarchaeota archaeon]|nr:hypothetical protein [Candidatus Lokiarchaeota archaeon]
MVDIKKQKKDLENVESILKKSNNKYNWIDLPIGKNEKKPVIITSCTYKKRVYDVIISAQYWKGVDDWACMRCYVFNTKNLPDDKLIDVYRLCLSLNFSIPETTFSISNDFVYLECDMPFDISSDDFAFEVKGLELGVGNFVENMLKLGLEPSPTAGEIRSKKLSYIS